MEQPEEGPRGGGGAGGGVVDTRDTALASHGAKCPTASPRSLLAGGASGDPPVRLPDETPEMFMLLCCLLMVCCGLWHARGWTHGASGKTCRCALPSRSRRMRGAKMGGAYDRFSDYPSPLMLLVYVLVSMAAPRPPSFLPRRHAGPDRGGCEGQRWGGRMAVSRTTLPR